MPTCHSLFRLRRRSDRSEEQLATVLPTCVVLATSASVSSESHSGSGASPSSLSPVASPSVGIDKRQGHRSEHDHDHITHLELPPSARTNRIQLQIATMCQRSRLSG